MEKREFNLADAERDNLTGLYRREVIYDYVHFLADNHRIFNYAILDVDNFKNINDGYGHRIGDIVLINVAKQLGECVGDRGVIGRYGGDEFIFVFEGDLNYDEQWQLCFSILRSPRPIETDSGSITVSYTMGMAKYPKDVDKVDDLFELADKALYRGKTKGRDCFIIYVEEKHRDIFLKSVREKSHSQMFLHTKIQNILFKNGEYEANVQEAVDFVASYLMLDMMYIQRENQIRDLYVTTLSDVKEAVVVDENLIGTYMGNGTTYFVENSLGLSKNSGDELYQQLIANGIFATVIVELRLFDHSYGFLRADMTIRGQTRIWQQNELTLLIELGQKLSFLYYLEEMGRL